MITLLVRLYEQYPWKCFFDTYFSSYFLERNIFLLFFNWIKLSSSTSYKSYDPGAAIVIEGVFCISNPFPINWFTDRYKAKIYVIQVKWSFHNRLFHSQLIWDSILKFLLFTTGDERPIE